MNQNKRNVLPMLSAIRKKADYLLKHTEIIIDKMLHDKQPISFNRIAVTAGVSKAWLYRHPTLRIKIENLRTQQLAYSNNQSQESNDAINNLLKQRIKKLETENAKLRKQLEIVYGELHLRK